MATEWLKSLVAMKEDPQVYEGGLRSSNRQGWGERKQKQSEHLSNLIALLLSIP